VVITTASYKHSRVSVVPNSYASYNHSQILTVYSRISVFSATIIH